MKLTSKDKAFLYNLRRLLEERQLRIEMKDDGLKHLVLRQNYGDRIECVFGITRQGVRWRFQRLFNEIYVESYERVWWIEANFGTELRHHAIAMAKERIDLRKQAQKAGALCFSRRETVKESTGSTDSKL
ncbi:MAG TPA: hypothetical protein PLC40_20460 [Candidatus Hydrogenedentes bacterium]|nr:hypothetical protein [Candidatus Hydrogenedentota bacterium]